MLLTTLLISAAVAGAPELLAPDARLFRVLDQRAEGGRAMPVLGYTAGGVLVAAGLMGLWQASTMRGALRDDTTTGFVDEAEARRRATTVNRTAILGVAGVGAGVTVVVGTRLSSRRARAPRRGR